VSSYSTNPAYIVYVFTIQQFKIKCNIYFSSLGVGKKFTSGTYDQNRGLSPKGPNSLPLGPEYDSIKSNSLSDPSHQEDLLPSLSSIQL